MIDILQFLICCAIAAGTFIAGAVWQDKASYAQGYQEGQGSLMATHIIAIGRARTEGYVQAQSYYLEFYRNCIRQDPKTGRWMKRGV